MNDRRRQTRRQTNDYFLVYNAETDELLGRVLDLTSQGAMMISETPISLPGTVKCRLVMPRMIGRHKHLHFEAECKWSKKNTRLGWYESGYEFINVSEDDEKLIAELIGDWSVKEHSEFLPTRAGGDSPSEFP